MLSCWSGICIASHSTNDVLINPPAWLKNALSFCTLKFLILHVHWTDKKTYMSSVYFVHCEQRSFLEREVIWEKVHDCYKKEMLACFHSWIADNDISAKSINIGTIHCDDAVRRGRTYRLKFERVSLTTYSIQFSILGRCFVCNNHQFSSVLTHPAASIKTNSMLLFLLTRQLA